MIEYQEYDISIIKFPNMFVNTLLAHHAGNAPSSWSIIPGSDYNITNCFFTNEKKRISEYRFIDENGNPGKFYIFKTDDIILKLTEEEIGKYVPGGLCNFILKTLHKYDPDCGNWPPEHYKAQQFIKDNNWSDDWNDWTNKQWAHFKLKFN